MNTTAINNSEKGDSDQSKIPEEEGERVDYQNGEGGVNTGGGYANPNEEQNISQLSPPNSTNSYTKDDNPTNINALIAGDINLPKNFSQSTHSYHPLHLRNVM